MQACNQSLLVYQMTHLIFSSSGIDQPSLCIAGGRLAGVGSHMPPAVVIGSSQVYVAYSYVSTQHGMHEVSAIQHLEGVVKFVK
jgi:hypothetical protein